MLSLLLSWLFMGWLFLVFGVAVVRLLAAILGSASKGAPLPAPDYLVLTGFSAVTVLAAIVSVFHALDAWTLTAFAVAGIGLSIGFKKNIWAVFKTGVQWWLSLPMPYKVAVFCVFIVAWVGAAGSQIVQADAKLYHVPSILWNKHYAVVPGLGNLHGRFAFNSHYFISGALFSIQLSESRVLFPLFSFFFLLFNTRMLHNLHISIRRNDWMYFGLNAALFILFIYQGVVYLSAVSTDDITMVLIGYVCFLFWTRAASKTSHLPLYLIWILVLTAITFKLSSLFLVLIIPFVAFPFTKKKVAILLAVALTIMGPFLYRNVILSGYLIYPFAKVDLFEVDWKVPKPLVEVESKLVTGYARLPHNPATEEEVLKMLESPYRQWVPDWWTTRLTLRWRLILLIDLTSILFLLIALARKEYRTAILFLVLLVNLAFWFVKAPDPRFAHGFLFFDLALVAAYCGHLLFSKKTFLFTRRIAYLFALAALVSLITKPSAGWTDHPWTASMLLFPAEQEHNPIGRFTALNFDMYIPVDGSMLCFTAPLPCTPYPKKQLMMRGSDFQDGFRIAKKINR